MADKLKRSKSIPIERVIIYVLFGLTTSLCEVRCSIEESGSGSGEGPLFPDISAQNNNTRCIPLKVAVDSNFILDECLVLFPEDKCFLFNYTTEFVRLKQNLDILNVALASSLGTPYCKDVLRTYVCNYVYPGCNPYTGMPQGICESECEQFVHNDCDSDFRTFIQVIAMAEQDIITVTDECSNTVEFTGVTNPDPSDCFNITDQLTEERPVDRPMTNPPPVITTEAPAESINITLLITLTLSVVLVVTLVLVLSVVIVCVWRIKMKHKSRSENNQIPLTSPGRRSLNTYQYTFELEDHMYDDPENAALFRFREEDVASFGDNIQLQDALLPFEQLQLTDVLGEGAFGRVHKGYFMKLLSDGTPKTIQVAVKTIKHTQGAYTELKNFIEESALMCSFDHPHVLGMVGICLDSCQSPYLILPFMEHGDLRTFLRKKREMATKSTDTGYPKGLEYGLLIRICSEIASGMEYLAFKKLVHRDLAARNCMVDSDISVKVGDFGLARDIYQTDYYRQNNRIKIPVKWMAPESLHDGISNEKTDVWSYGVTCWEVFSLGRVPYPTILNQDILEHLESGNRLKRSALASDVIHDLMQDCWQQDPKKRPKFSEITIHFTTTIFPDTAEEMYSSIDPQDEPMTSTERTLQSNGSALAATVAPMEEQPLLDSIISHFEKTPPASFILGEEDGAVANSFLQSLKMTESLEAFNGGSLIVSNPYTQHPVVTLSDHMTSQRDCVTLVDPNGDYYTEINPRGALLSGHPYQNGSTDRAHATSSLIIANEYDEVTPENNIISSEHTTTTQHSPMDNYIEMFPA